MRVNANGSLFFDYRTAKNTDNKAGISPCLTSRSKNDHLTLSKEVRAIIEAQNRMKQLQEAKKNAENSAEVQMIKQLKKAMDILKACSMIAARVRDGDKVPLKDLQYLMNNDPAGYQLAMAARKPKADPKNWKSAIPKEQQENQSNNSESIEMEVASSAEISSGDTEMSAPAE